MSGRRIALAVMALLGCGRRDFDALSDGAPAGDEISIDDATPQGCSVWGPWSTPVAVPEFAAGAEELDPSFSGDSSKLWYVRQAAGYDIFVVTEDGSGQYGGETAESFNTANDEADPNLTIDGLDIVFVSARPQQLVYEARRSAADQPFGPAAVALGLETTVVDSITLGGDGLTLYYVIGTTFWSVTRPDRGSAFGAPTMLAFSVEWPDVSGDQLEMYFQRGASAFQRTRATVADAFANETQLMSLPNGFNGDFGITRDGAELWFDDFDHGLYKFTRTCVTPRSP